MPGSKETVNPRASMAGIRGEPCLPADPGDALRREPSKRGVILLELIRPEARTWNSKTMGSEATAHFSGPGFGPAGEPVINGAADSAASPGHGRLG